METGIPIGLFSPSLNLSKRAQTYFYDIVRPLNSSDQQVIRFHVKGGPGPLSQNDLSLWGRIIFPSQGESRIDHFNEEYIKSKMGVYCDTERPTAIDLGSLRAYRTSGGDVEYLVKVNDSDDARTRGETTPAFDEAKEILEKLENYPILDEDGVDEAKMEEARENIAYTASKFIQNGFDVEEWVDKIVDTMYRLGNEDEATGNSEPLNEHVKEAMQALNILDPEHNYDKIPEWKRDEVDRINNILTSLRIKMKRMVDNFPQYADRYRAENNIQVTELEKAKRELLLGNSSNPQPTRSEGQLTLFDLSDEALSYVSDNKLLELRKIRQQRKQDAAFNNAVEQVMQLVDSEGFGDDELEFDSNDIYASVGTPIRLSR